MTGINFELLLLVFILEKFINNLPISRFYQVAVITVVDSVLG